MTRPEELSQWETELNHHLPSLSKPQASELALWSIGMVLADSASLQKVALRIHIWLAEQGQLIDSYRERLRSWYLPAERKAGDKRCDWNPDDLFGEFVVWVLRLIDEERVVLAIDATTLRDRVTILCVSVLIGGCAIPVAWRCLPGNRKDEWNRHWLALLQTISLAIPQEMEIIVLSDRGLWSPFLFQAIQDHGWHPLMRVNWDNGENCSYFRPQGGKWRTMVSLAPAKGEEVRLAGEAFASHGIPSTLIIYWGESAQEPWYLLTDSSPLPDLDGPLYAERMWIEHQFKTIKSDGWNVTKSRITEPDRIARMWLAYAVAMLWTMSVGSHPIAGVDRPARLTDNRGSTPAPEAGEASAQPTVSLPAPAPPPPSRRSLPQQPSLSTVAVPWTFSQTYSWFRRGITLLADRIAGALELECPRFYSTLRLTAGHN